MSLSKKAVAELAREIRTCRVMAIAFSATYCNETYSHPYFVGALKSTLVEFVTKQLQDATEIRTAFDYEPTPDEVRDEQAASAKAEANHKLWLAGEGITP